MKKIRKQSKNLVISGGGHTFLWNFERTQKSVISVENIESIYIH